MGDMASNASVDALMEFMACGSDCARVNPGLSGFVAPSQTGIFTGFFPIRLYLEAPGKMPGPRGAGILPGACNGRGSPAQIVLIEQLESALVEDGDGEFIILDVQGEE